MKANHDGRGKRLKILHVCLASSYTEGMTYQDNMLADQNVEDGHEVVVVSDCTCYEKGRIVPTEPEDRILANGIRLVRLPYDRIFTRFVSDKIRKTKRLRPLIDQFAPDVILFHGCAGYELITAAKYKKAHPHVKLYADSHEDFTNSARNWLSKNILHRIIYRFFFQRAKNQIDKVLCTSPLRLQFVKQIYNAPLELLEVFRMGGTILSESEREEIRDDLRKAHGVTDNQILLLHAGKLDKLKKTVELLQTFQKISDLTFRLIIAGAISEEIESEFYAMLKEDNRIQYIGWLSGFELDRLYCAADVYLQPGRHSVNVENAVCKGCAMIVSPSSNQMQTVSHENGWEIGDIEEIQTILKEILSDRTILMEKKENSLSYAKKNLDYVKLAKRYTTGYESEQEK